MFGSVGAASAFVSRCESSASGLGTSGGTKAEVRVRGIFARRVGVQREVVLIVVARIIDRKSKSVENHAIRFVASSLVFRLRETTSDECRAM
jgi:hypothetical protein